MAQVKKTLKPSDPEVEVCVNEEIKDGELQEIVEIIEEIVETTKTEEIVEQTDIEETTVIEELKKGGVLKAKLGEVVLPEYIPVIEEDVNEPLDEALYKGRMSAIEDIYVKDPHEKAAALARLNSEYGKTPEIKTESIKTSNKLGLPFYLREATNLAN